MNIPILKPCIECRSMEQRAPDNYHKAAVLRKRFITPIMKAAWNGHKNCIDKIVSSGADVNKQDIFYGSTSLMLASSTGQNHCLEALIEAGADVNIQDRSGETALTYAAIDGKASCMKILIEAGANAEKRTNNATTALMLAADRGHERCLDVLLGAGVNVNVQDGSGRTALIFAADTGYLKCIQLLLAAGASVNSFDSNDETALNVAMRPREMGNNFGRRSHLGRSIMWLRAWTRKYYSHSTPFGGKTEVAKLLFVAGGTTGRNIPGETHDFFEESEESRLGLKSQCRRAIRKHLMRVNVSSNLVVDVLRLGLPSSLRSYLLFYLDLSTL